MDVFFLSVVKVFLVVSVVALYTGASYLICVMWIWFLRRDREFIGEGIFKWIDGNFFRIMRYVIMGIIFSGSFVNNDPIRVKEFLIGTSCAALFFIFFGFLEKRFKKLSP
ncbi:hypothetical protein ACFL2R_03360 [Patescibacteria group bacterium]